MLPSVGRIVNYRMSAQDADTVNRRRTTSSEIAGRLEIGTWPRGAQAHIGNMASEGDVVAMIVVRTWPGQKVNGQAFLDGNDVLWVTSAPEGLMPGTWAWPQRVEG